MNEIKADSEFIQLSDEQKAQLAECEPVEFELWEENSASFDFFTKIQTQWFFSPNGVLSGLNYTSAIAVMQIFEPECKKQLFADLQLIEIGVLQSVRV